MSYNAQDLREILSEEIQKLIEGETSVAKVNAVSNAVGKIINTVKTELSIYKLTGKTPSVEFLEQKEKYKGETK